MDRLRGFLNDPRGWLLFTLAEFAMVAALFVLVVPRGLPNWANLLALAGMVLVLVAFNGWFRRRLDPERSGGSRRGP